MAKIIVALRTLNEEILIPRFMAAYGWADLIVVADGGSTDRTLEMLQEYPNVVVYHFNEWVENDKGGRRNPEGKHMNFLLDKAYQYDPDWLIQEDADTMMTPILRDNIRFILENTKEMMVWAPLMYIYGSDKWFPQLTGGDDFSPGKPGDNWTGAWAWNKTIKLMYDETPGAAEWTTAIVSDPPVRVGSHRCLAYPYARLHYFCFTPELKNRKLALYQSSGQVKHDWIQTCGPLKDLPEWASPTYYKP